jgi:hypothetical protein
VLVDLTAAGRRAGQRVLDARAAVLQHALRSLDDDERRELAMLAERLLADATGSRRAARTICRLCDAHACGHHDGRCPVTRAADALEAR